MMRGLSQLIQVAKETITAGREAEYEAIEQDTARACAELKCPHPHLALEPVSRPGEIWWLNLFSSEADRQRVVDEYARNAPLMAVLERNGSRKAGITERRVDLLSSYRPDLSRGAQLALAGARFIIVTVNPDTASSEGAVFEAGDGTLLLFRSAGTRLDADRVAGEGSTPSTVLAVRPSWGMPATDWIEADPEFWPTRATRRG